jgi:hypothetical protein
VRFTQLKLEQFNEFCSYAGYDIKLLADGSSKLSADFGGAVRVVHPLKQKNHLRVTSEEFLHLLFVGL